MFSGIYSFHYQQLTSETSYLIPSCIRNKKGKSSVWNLWQRQLSWALFLRILSSWHCSNQEQGKGPVFPLSSACPGPTEGQQRPEKKAWVSQGSGTCMKEGCRQLFQYFVIVDSETCYSSLTLSLQVLLRMIESSAFKINGKSVILDDLTWWCRKCMESSIILCEGSCVHHRNSWRRQTATHLLKLTQLTYCLPACHVQARCGRLIMVLLILFAHWVANWKLRVLHKILIHNFSRKIRAAMKIENNMSDSVPGILSWQNPLVLRVGPDLWYRAMPSLLSHGISLAHLPLYELLNSSSLGFLQIVAIWSSSFPYGRKFPIDNIASFYIELQK